MRLFKRYRFFALLVILGIGASNVCNASSVSQTTDVGDALQHYSKIHSHDPFLLFEEKELEEETEKKILEDCFLPTAIVFPFLDKQDDPQELLRGKSSAAKIVTQLFLLHRAIVV